MLVANYDHITNYDHIIVRVRGRLLISIRYSGRLYMFYREWFKLVICVRNFLNGQLHVATADAMLQATLARSQKTVNGLPNFLSGY